MRVELTGKHVAISPGLRRLVDQKLAKVHRVLNDAGVSAQVVATKEKINNVVEVTLHARGEKFLHAVGKAGTWESAMTDVVGKLLHQTEKVKGKWQERKRRGQAARSVKTPREARAAASRAARPVTGGEPGAGEPAEPVARVRTAPPRLRVERKQSIRRVKYTVKPMTADQAVAELEAQAAPFVMFRDAASDTLSVLYRRDDGQFALIEPDA